MVADDAGDIVVTARRREERLQDVPVSITAIGGDTLTKIGVSNTADLPAVVPGLRFPRSAQTVQPTIRGVGNRASGTGNESNVAMYVDGFYQPDSYAAAISLLQTQRVEVLRGPQGTLFGRNATGGLVNVITMDPGQDVTGNVELRAGSFKELSGKAYLSGPISDAVAADIAVYGYRNSGYIDDLVNGGKINPREAVAVRSKWVFDVADDTRLTLSASYTNDDDPSVYSYQPLNGNARGQLFGAILPTEKRQAALSSGTMPKLKLNQTTATARLSHTMDWATLFIEGSYGRSESSYIADSDATTALLAGSDGRFVVTHQTAETRLVSEGSGPFQWIFGLFGFHANTKIDPLHLPTFTNQVLSSESFLRGDASVDSLAWFAEFNYQITPALRATLGGRYTYEERGFDARSDGRTVATGVTTTRTVDRSISFGRFTPRGTIQYVFSPRANIYASYSKGFKSGVFNAGSIAGGSVAPESIQAYEVGFKTEPFRGLLLNGSVFKYSYKDLQVSARDPNGISVFANAAAAKIKGGEVEAVATLGRDTRLRLGMSYLDATYTAFPNAQVFIPLPNFAGNATATQDVSGKRLPQAPKWTVNSTLDHVQHFDGGDLGLALNAYYSAKFYWESSNRIAQPAFILLSGEVSWRFKNGVKIAIWGENLANEDIFLTIVPSANADSVVYERPRRGGVSLSYAF